MENNFEKKKYKYNLEFDRKCYEIGQKAAWQSNEMIRIASKMGIFVNKNEILRCAKRYASAMENVGYKEIKAKVETGNKIQKEKEYQFTKFLYESLLYYKNDNVKKKELAKRLGMSLETVRNKALKYAENHLGLSKEQAKKQLESTQTLENNSSYDKYKNVIEKMITITKAKDLILFLYSVDNRFSNKQGNDHASDKAIDVANLSRYVYLYCKEKNNPKLEASLQKKVEFYREYVRKRKQAKVNEKRTTAGESRTVRIIKELIISGEPYKKFIRTKGMNLVEFDRKLNLLKETDEDLYKDCLNYIKWCEKEEKLRVQNDVAILKKCIAYIKNGIVVNGKKRDFTIIDLYVFSGKVAKEIYELLCYLTSEERTCLSTFLQFRSETEYYKRKEKDGLYSSEKEILKGNYYINIKDQDGNIVTQREISQKEKEAIMRFLHEKTAIVVNQRFFNIAKHLYEDGNLFASDKSIYADPEDNQERDKKRR